MVAYKEICEVTKEVNDCIVKYGQSGNGLFVCSGDNQEKRLVITDRTISEESCPPHILTDSILEKYFPLNPIKTYHHFTDLNAVLSIIRSGKLRLTSVAKRFNEYEFLPFYDAHNMTGYKDRVTNGVSLGEELCKNAFYLSLTDESNQNPTMLNDFGNVRLVFDLINNRCIDLREIYYPNKKTDLEFLTELEAIAQKRGKDFIIHGLSRIGFFYLPIHWKDEREYRLLIFRDKTKCLNLSFGVSGEGFEYIEIPFDDNSFPIHLTLTKVIVQTDDSKKQVEELLRLDKKYNNVIVENA